MKDSFTILLVEDSPADIHITRRALRDSQLAVELIVVRDGQEAIDYLMRQGKHGGNAAWRRPDLVLLDLNLPRMTGCEVLQCLRRHPALPLVPVVVLSTSSRQEDVQALYAAGANTYLVKPQDFNRFVDVLRTMQRYWLEMATLPRPLDETP